MNVKIIIIVLLAVAILFSSAGCGKKVNADANENNKAVILVQTSKVEQGSIAQTIDVTGSLTAVTDIQLSARAAGRINSVLVQEGDIVQAGQVVVVQDTSDLVLQKNQVEASLQMANADRARAVSSIESAKAQLQKAQTAAKYQPQQSDAAIAGAEAQLKAAQARLSAMEAGARPQEREQAVAAVNSAKANMERAKADYERTKALYDEGALSAQQMDAAKAGYETARSQYKTAVEAKKMIDEGPRSEDIDAARQQVIVAEELLNQALAGKSQDSMREDDVTSAKASLKAAQAALDASNAGIRSANAQLSIINQNIGNMAVRSPVIGVVAQRIAQPGQSGIPGSPLLRIVDLKTVVFDGVVSETDLRFYKQGQIVKVSVDAYPDKSFKGIVERIYPAGNTTTRNFKIRINVDNTGNDLKPGMFARGSTNIKEYSGATLIAKEAIVKLGDDNWVWVIQGNKALRRAIKIELTNSDRAMVSGVNPGETVVTRGQEGLQEGSEVKIDTSKQGGENVVN